MEGLGSPKDLGDGDPVEAQQAPNLNQGCHLSHLAASSSDLGISDTAVLDCVQGLPDTHVPR